MRYHDCPFQVRNSMLDDEEPKETDTEESVEAWIKKFNNAYLEIVSI